SPSSGVGGKMSAVELGIEREVLPASQHSLSVAQVALYIHVAAGVLGDGVLSVDLDSRGVHRTSVPVEVDEGGVAADFVHPHSQVDRVHRHSGDLVAGI